MFRDIFYELSRGLAYRRIDHPSMKIYTIWLPVLATILTLGAYIMLPVRPALVGEGNVLAASMSVLSTLPGFYFAGLAAVATFGNASMDTVMPAPAPRMDIRVAGSMKSSELSRRLFLSYLFGYLTLLSLILCGIILFVNSISGSLGVFHASLIGIQHGPEIWEALKLISVAVLGFFGGSLVITTFHGMFFLMERIHQP